MHTILSIALSAVLLSVLVAPDPATTTQPHQFTYSVNQPHPGCLTCHHPHRAVGQIPEWQVVPGQPAVLTLYQSRPGLPNSSSLMCLTCHDGALADEIHLKPTPRIVSQVGNSVAISDGRIGFPLGSHPVGVAYDQHTDKLAPRRAVEADKRIVLPDGRIECISCHDPHGTEGHKSLLVKSNRRSALCLTCHRL